VMNVLKDRATYSQVLYVDVMTGRGGQKCDECSEGQSNILTGIICRYYDQQSWAKQGKNVLDVLKNRATYSSVLYVQ
jgi:hypothetical protein